MCTHHYLGALPVRAAVSGRCVSRRDAFLSLLFFVGEGFAFRAHSYKLRLNAWRENKAVYNKVAAGAL